MLLSLCTTHAVSQPIQLTATEVLFNFDFRDAALGPPYVTIEFRAEFDPIDPINVGVDTMITNVYGDLNGVQLLQSRNDTAPGFPFDVSFNDAGTVYGPLFTANPIFNPMLDGTYSFGLRLTSGSARLMSFTSCGLDAISGSGPCLTYPTSPIPEPENVALLAAGLAVLTLLRRVVRRN